MEEAYQLAGRKIREKGDRAKKIYDRWVRSSVVEPGDRVLVRNLSERGGPGKLRSFWENQIHVVVKRRGIDSPVYEVQPERGSGKTRVLHRNLLLPCDYLPANAHQEAPRRPTVQRQPRQPPPKTISQDGETSSDEECTEVVTSPLPTERQVTPPSQDLTSPAPDHQPINENPPVPGDPMHEEIAVDPQLDVPLAEPRNPEGEHTIPGDEIPTVPDNSRPQRARHPPQRLTYYNPGEPLGVFPISTPSPQHPWFSNQFNSYLKPPVYHPPQHIPFHYPQLFPGPPFLPLQPSPFPNQIPPFPVHITPMMPPPIC